MYGSMGEKPNGNGTRWHAISPDLLDPEGVHNSPPVFPGHNGLPFKGDIPDLRHDDPEHMQPQEGGIVHTEQMDLSDPKDLQHLADIRQLVVNQTAYLCYEERIYDAAIKSWRVLICWVEQHSYVPKHGRNHYGSGL